MQGNRRWMHWKATISWPICCCRFTNSAAFAAAFVLHLLLQRCQPDQCRDWATGKWEKENWGKLARREEREERDKGREAGRDWVATDGWRLPSNALSTQRFWGEGKINDAEMVAICRLIKVWILDIERCSIGRYWFTLHVSVQSTSEYFFKKKSLHDDTG